MGTLTITHVLTLALLLTPLAITAEASPPPRPASNHSQHHPPTLTAESLPTAGLVPAGPVGYYQLVNGEPFQLCLACRCCDANDPTLCSSMPCCYGIDCNLPGKPYGVCAFVPKVCNCTSCS